MYARIKLSSIIVEWLSRKKSEMVMAQKNHVCETFQDFLRSMNFTALICVDKISHSFDLGIVFVPKNQAIRFAQTNKNPTNGFVS